jgi:hypothetical protein
VNKAGVGRLQVGFVGAMVCIVAEGRNTVAAGLWLLPWFAVKALQRASEVVQTRPSPPSPLTPAPPQAGASSPRAAQAAPLEQGGVRWQVAAFWHDRHFTYNHHNGTCVILTTWQACLRL